MDNIILIGFMGCGKTSAGRRIAKKLGAALVDTDQMVVKQAGMEITEIFAKHGEAYFRVLEHQAVLEVASGRNQVVSTGGGVVKSAANVAALKQNGTIVYIKCSPVKIYNNTRGDTARPLLNTGNRLKTIRKLMSERSPLYEAAADITVDASKMNVAQLANIIIKLCREAKNEKAANH